MNAARSWLWQLPAHGLLHKERQWFACADRSLGEAWGLLVPLRAASPGWEIAAPEDSLLELARIPVDAPRVLPPPVAAEGATHYLCMLRYDHPGDRSASAFRFGFHPRKADAVADDGGDAMEDKASVPQLRAALQALQRQHGAELARELVSAGEPAAPAGALCFAFGSCQFQPGMMDRLQATASYRALGERFPGGAQLPTRLLLLGDQVYTDATYGLLDPARLDDRYRRPYEELLAPEGAMGQLPLDFQRVVRMTPDDHEIGNDWEPSPAGTADERRARGLAAYWQYQRGEERDQAMAKAQERAPVWMQEADAAAGWRLFMADTRTARDFRDEASIDEALVLGARQTAELEAWLRSAPAGDLKVVTSAAMLLPRTRLHLGEPLRLDGWQGYPASLHALLALLCEEQVRNVVFLAGDAHLACSARVTVTSGDKRCAFDSHHAPALYAPFPFANESRWNLLLKDRFGFEHQGRRYQCRVAARVAGAGVHGCGLLHAQRDGEGWRLRAELLRAD